MARQLSMKRQETLVSTSSAARVAPCRTRLRRCAQLAILSSLGGVAVAFLACNAVLGIDDATLCGEGCDGGVSSLSDDVAPNLPGSESGRDDAGMPGPQMPGTSEGVPAVSGVTMGGASEGSNSAGDNSGSNSSGNGPGSSSSNSEDEGSTGDGPDADGQSGAGGGGGTDNSGSGNSGSGNSGSGNPGSGNAGSSSSGPDGDNNPGPGDTDEVPPPPSPCDGRQEGSAFCDGAVRISCGPDGSVAGTLPCPTAPHCTESTGPACAACLTGDARCTGAILSVCNEAHTGFDTTACAGPAQCNQARARCEAAACAANQLRCDGAVLQICNANLTGFDPVVDCGSPAACNADTGACNVCSPGTRRCIDSSTVGICDSNGQTEAQVGCTRLIERCVAGECELLGL